MARLNTENDQKWMQNLAEKHGIDVETVRGFYETTHNSRSDRIFTGGSQLTKRQRTESFFDLYFEGVKEGN